MPGFSIGEAGPPLNFRPGGTPEAVLPRSGGFCPPAKAFSRGRKGLARRRARSPEFRRDLRGHKGLRFSEKEIVHARTSLSPVSRDGRIGNVVRRDSGSLSRRQNVFLRPGDGLAPLHIASPGRATRWRPCISPARSGDALAPLHFVSPGRATVWRPCIASPGRATLWRPCISFRPDGRYFGATCTLLHPAHLRRKLARRDFRLGPQVLRPSCGPSGREPMRGLTPGFRSLAGLASYSLGWHVWPL